MSKNRTFSALVGIVEEELQLLRDAQVELENVNNLREEVVIKIQNRSESLAKARDELLQAYPELVPLARQVDQASPATRNGFEFVETDDPDDVPVRFRETEV